MRTWIFAFSVAVAMSCGVLGAELTADARECFDWFSKLGFPDIKAADWVEVWEGVDTGRASDPPLTLTAHGFILSETDVDFRILTQELTETTFTKKTPEFRAVSQVRHQEALFFEMAGKRLQELQLRPNARLGRLMATLDLKAEIFFLSFACWRKGNTELAQEMFDAAARLPSEQYGEEGPLQAKLTMQVELEREIGHAAIWDGVLRFGGDGLGEHHRRTSGKLMPRSELLALFRKIVRLYPNSPHLKSAQETVAMLEKMVAEDAAHAPITLEEIAKLPVEKQVEEWIFRLRDQNGHQYMQPGGCDIFDELREGRNGTSPAHQLVRIGYPAVPQLIEALSNERFSRSVGYHRDFHFSHTVLRVSDCAHVILERIAGCTFPHTRSGDEWREIDMASIRDNVTAWWKEAEVKGEKQMLIDLLSSGREHPYALVARLRNKYPEAVTDALLRGARAAREDWIARDFIVEAGEINSEAATDVLLEKLDGNYVLGIRMEAAVQLMNRNHPSALKAAFNEWSKNSRTAMEDPFAFHHSALDLLIASGKTAAMREVVGDWDKRPASERLRIVIKIGSAMKPHEGKYVPSELVRKPLDDEAKNIGRALLAHALDDAAVLPGFSGSFGDYTFRDPRICDIALWELHNIQPEVYAFSSKAGPEQRETERINAVKKLHHEP